MRNKRYHFWRVFWVVIALYLFFMVIGLVFASMTPGSEDKSYVWNKLVEWRHLAGQMTGMLFSVFFFYFTLNIYYRLFAEKKGVVGFIKASILGIIALVLYQLVSFSFLTGKEEFRQQMQGKDLSAGILIFSLALAILFQVGLSFLIAYLTYLRDEKKQGKILEEQKMQLEVEKSQANFNFLKAQINPHFLHNTLNFLYAKSLPYSPELSEGILTLSDIMRYALSQGNEKDGKAPLKDEIEHVRNVIKINQLRFSNNLNVQFSAEGVMNGAMIIPFVLITLVENAFKHGDIKSNEYPIVIRVRTEDNALSFYCSNHKKSGPKELSTGIGLDNIKKRLELAYGKNYLLNIKDEAEFYTTELTIAQL